MIRIRDFIKSDTVPLRKLIHGTIDACYTDVYPPRAVEFFKDFHCTENILERAEKGQTVILEIGDKIIGTGTLLGNTILGVFVHPEFQHRGYGKDLMAELETRAEAIGRTELELSVSLPSREFYQRLGYRILKKKSLDVGEGQTLDYWQAEKSL
jgi:GNAT superfamily N-acetyltransferase